MAARVAEVTPHLPHRPRSSHKLIGLYRAEYGDGQRPPARRDGHNRYPKVLAISLPTDRLGPNLRLFARLT